MDFNKENFIVKKIYKSYLNILLFLLKTSFKSILINFLLLLA